MSKRHTTIKEISRWKFSEIPKPIWDDHYVDDENKRIFIYRLLHWARKKAQLFDDDLVTFIQVAGLQTTDTKGLFVLLNEREFSIHPLEKGGSFELGFNKAYGWQPIRLYPDALRFNAEIFKPKKTTKEKPDKK